MRSGDRGRKQGRIRYGERAGSRESHKKLFTYSKRNKSKFYFFIIWDICDLLQKKSSFYLLHSFHHRAQKNYVYRGGRVAGHWAGTVSFLTAIKIHVHSGYSQNTKSKRPKDILLK